MSRVDEVYEHVCMALRGLSQWFVPHMKLTFIARHPGNPEADMVVTDDDMREAAKALKRRLRADCLAAREGRRRR